MFHTIKGDNERKTYIIMLNAIFNGITADHFSDAEIYDVRERLMHDGTTKTVIVLHKHKKENAEVIGGIFTMDRNDKGAWVKRASMLLSPETLLEAGDMIKTAQVLFGTKND